MSYCLYMETEIRQIIFTPISPEFSYLQPTLNMMDKMILNDPEIMSIDIKYTREGDVEMITIKKGKGKCQNCGEFYPMGRAWAKFCSNKCRQAAFRAKSNG